MGKLNEIADTLRKLADEIDRQGLSSEINKKTWTPPELVEAIKARLSTAGDPALLQTISDTLYERYEVTRVLQLTDAQATELAEIIGVEAKTFNSKESK